MGWLYKRSWRNKSDCVAEVTRPSSSTIEDTHRLDRIRRWRPELQMGDQVIRECLRKSLKDNRLWTVWERRHVREGRDIIPPERTICLYLLDKHDGYWGYKDVPEAMGPAYHDCPLSYLTLAPPPARGTPDAIYSLPWRQEVRALAEGRKRRMSRTEAGEVTD